LPKKETLKGAGWKKNSKINPETLDCIIFAHNFGDVPYGKNQSDAVPSLASRVKHQLKITV
jgi:3-oxoacyl-[acyl-carrier-protein] synthase-3